MAIHLSKSVIGQLIASREAITACRKKPFTMKGVDTDAFHRRFRILHKHGLMKRKDNGDFWLYEITSKGRSFLLDL